MPLDASQGGSLDLSYPQYVFLKTLDTKYRAFVGGFGSGKTFVGCLDLLMFVGEHPGNTQGYFAPTYRDIRDTFVPTFLEAAELLGFNPVWRSTDKEIHIYRGRAFYGTIICRSMDDPQSIVGFKLARALVDEIDVLQKTKAQDAWNKIIARLRLVVPGVENSVGVTTTPEGFRFVYDRFAHDPGPFYSMVQASTYENQRFLPPDYIDSLRESYPQNLIEAYLMGQFVNLTTGTVYSSFDRRKNNTDIAAPRKFSNGGGEPIYVGMDFNVQKMAAGFSVKRGDVFHMFAEAADVTDTPSMIDLIQNRYEDHPIRVYPDASGRNTSSKSASESDIAILEEAGFSVFRNSTNPRVRDRVISMNKAFEDGKLLINVEACPRAVKCFEQQPYDENGEPNKKVGLDHLPDAVGYKIHYNMPVVKPVARLRRTRGM